MPHHSATQDDNRASSGKIPVPRAIVLRSGHAARRTLGFPALPDGPKRVWFDPPRLGICTLDGGAAATDCLVLGIWDGGARLRVRDARLLTEFDLLFASGPKPVKRRCKRLLVRGQIIDVEFKRTTPCYVMESGPEG